MCGIAGIFSPGSRQDRNAATLAEAARRMNAELVHRGPDGHGEAVIGLSAGSKVALAHRRLRVVDLSERGAQPMTSRRTGSVLVYNGEIYNFRQLRAELQAHGFVFESDCDTEVVLHAYDAWGLDAFARFRGMWALALVDPANDRLLLSRDRFGVKPLYYAWHAGELLFASEIKAILAGAPTFPRRMEEDALVEYLGFRQPLEERTWFAGISRVAPGYNLLIESGASKRRRYWQLPVPLDHPEIGLERAMEQVRTTLAEAVSLRMISDVPVGAYLSGGLDSSVIVQEMVARAKAEVPTFSVGFDDPEFDESAFAREVATSLGTRHVELALHAEMYFEALDPMIHTRDAPLAVPNEVALYLLSRELKKRITVVLSGEGADELFGGYGRIFRSAEDLEKFRWLAPASGLTAAERSKLSESLNAAYASPPRDLIDLFLQRYVYLPEADLRAVLAGPARELPSDQLLRRAAFERLFTGTEALAPAERFMHVFQRSHLAALLDRLDATTMAFAVEARVPFVDHVLVSQVQQLPLDYRIRWRSEESREAARLLSGERTSERYDDPKHVLREAFRSRLPASIVDRRKVGFPVPLERWLATPTGAAACEPLWSRDARTRDILDQTTLRSWGSPNASAAQARALFMCLNVELWMRHYDVQL
jgi:asparagine synthase (glutamine-hydrolysing)